MFTVWTNDNRLTVFIQATLFIPEVFQHLSCEVNFIKVTRRINEGCDGEITLTQCLMGDKANQFTWFN